MTSSRQTRPRTAVKNLTFALLTIVLICVPIEIASSYAYRAIFKKSLSKAEILGGMQDAISYVKEDKAEEFSEGIGIITPHPLVGFSYNTLVHQLHDIAQNHQPFPQSQCAVSNDGFITTGKEPALATDQDYVVLVTGASVANQMVCAAGEQLKEAIAKKRGIAPQKVLLFGMAIGTWQQPQMVNALVYYLSLGRKLNLVINLDGYNDAANAYIDPEAKSYWAYGWKNMMTRISMRKGNAESNSIQRLRNVRAFVARVFKKMRFSNFACLAWRTIDERLASRIVALNLKAMRDHTEDGEWKFARTGPPLPDLDDSLVRIWANSSRLAHLLTASHGAKYYHFLQPTPAEIGSKPLSAEEKTRKEQDYEVAAIGLLYPKMKKEGAKMVKAGIHFVDLSDIFKNETRTIYVDTCCHMNHLGSSILVSHIASRLDL